MTFRTNQSLAFQYNNLKQLAAHLKTQCASYRTRTASGPFPISEISTGLLGLLVETADRFLSAPSGLAAYAQEQEADPTYDVVAEFLAMRTAVVAARDWLATNLPKDGSNRLLERILNADGSITNITVSSAQTAQLRTLLQAVEDTIA